jgi:trans-feruloyl-CoA hydratase/vanillin synthase
MKRGAMDRGGESMTEHNYECVKLRARDGIAWAALNRPEKRNAMSPQLHYEMDDALARLEVDDSVKVVVVTGEGGNFSAGQDLKKFFRELEKNPGERKKAAAAANRWRWERLYGYDKPTIAMVEGYCVGGAFMQLLACDFAIAAENATFCLSEVNWGILPGALVSKAVADTVLPRHALYYACLGEPFDGQEAARIGMVNYAVPAGKLEAATIELAQKLMKKSPAVLRATKQAIRHVRTMDVPQAYDYLAEKGKAIKAADREDSYNTGLRQFLDEKSYKPTFEPFRLGTESAPDGSKAAKAGKK